MDTRKELWEKVKELRKEGKYAVLKYDSNFLGNSAIKYKCDVFQHSLYSGY